MEGFEEQFKEASTKPLHLQLKAHGRNAQKLTVRTHGNLGAHFVKVT